MGEALSPPSLAFERPGPRGGPGRNILRSPDYTGGSHDAMGAVEVLFQAAFPEGAPGPEASHVLAYSPDGFLCAQLGRGMRFIADHPRADHGMYWPERVLWHVFRGALCRTSVFPTSASILEGTVADQRVCLGRGRDGRAGEDREGTPPGLGVGCSAVRRPHHPSVAVPHHRTSADLLHRSTLPTRFTDPLYPHRRPNLPTLYSSLPLRSWAAGPDGTLCAVDARTALSAGAEVPAVPPPRIASIRPRPAPRIVPTHLLLNSTGCLAALIGSPPDVREGPGSVRGFREGNRVGKAEGGG